MTRNAANLTHTEDLASIVRRIVESTPVTDMHTHLYSPDFGNMLLWGIDELLVYHYLISETFRWLDMPYEHFWALNKCEQADIVWRKLFLEHSPISEAASGVLTIFRRLGLDVASRDLDSYRAEWALMSVEDQVDRVMKAAGVRDIVMTNDPFDPMERPVWLERGGNRDSRFHAVLRVDSLLNDWPNASGELRAQGYNVTDAWDMYTVEETRRFLKEWIQKMDALYLAVSMSGDFVYPAEDHRTRMIEDAIIPACEAAGIPFALMIGVRRLVNPQLRLAGDMSMRSEVSAVEALCRKYPQMKFLVTMLARENQHELAVLARKFRNLMIFGCWWFLHIESIVEEMTRFRFELLGTSMIPQHSDCRVFEQLVYKWEHSRRIIADVLTEKYEKLQHMGWTLTEEEIQRDVDDLLRNNFWNFIGRPQSERV